MIPEEYVAIIQYMSNLCRECWQEIWQGWRDFNGCVTPPGSSISYECCIPSSFALKNVLERVLPEIRWEVVAGHPTKSQPKGGFVDSFGHSHAHHWVEGKFGKTYLICDITSDQFGGLPVFIAEGLISNYIKNVSKNIIKQHEKIVQFDVSMWTSMIDFIMKEKQF